MAGFADGFRTGYGVVADSMQARRRAELEERRLGANAKRDASIADYRSRTADLQERRIEAEEGRTSELRRQDRQDRRDARQERARVAAREARDSVSASQDELLRGDREREAEDRQAEIDRANAERLRLGNQKAERDLRIAGQREAQEKLAGFLSGTGEPEGARDALRTLEGTPAHPASVLGPDFRRRQELAMDFADGTRSDYGSPEFIEAVDHALSVDTALMRRMQSSRPGMGEIQDMSVAEVQPAEGGIQVRLRVQADGGGYDAWVTQGRSTEPDAERATIPMDRITDNLTGMSFYRAAMEDDPEFRGRMLRLIYESNPQKYDNAMRNARSAYENYLDSRSAADVGEPTPLSEFEQDALRSAFATDALPGGGGGGGGGGGDEEVVDFGDWN